MSTPVDQTTAQANPNQVVVAEPQQHVVTRDLFNVSQFDNSPDIAKVFGLKPVVSKGVVVGGDFSMGKKRDVAKALQLEGKANADALDAKTREIKAEAMTAVKKHIAGLSQDWVLHKFTTRQLSDGTKQQTMVTREMKQDAKAQFLKYARAMGFSEEEVEAMLAKANGAKPAVNVETTVTTTASPAPAAPAAKK